MRVIFLTSALILMAAAAAAAPDRPTTGPNGIDVPGPTNYRLDVSTGRVIHIQDIRSTRDVKEFWRRQDLPGGAGKDAAASSGK